MSCLDYCAKCHRIINAPAGSEDHYCKPCVDYRREGCELVGGATPFDVQRERERINRMFYDR